MTLTTLTSVTYLSLVFITRNINILWFCLAMTALAADIIVSIYWLRSNFDGLSNLQDLLMHKLHLPPKQPR